jgi:hypothetical protein
MAGAGRGDAVDRRGSACEQSGVWELDALPPDELERTVEADITAHIDIRA